MGEFIKMSKFFKIIIFLVLCTVLNLQLTSNMVKAETQREMNHKAAKIYEKKDKELNEIFNKIILKHKEDKVFIQKLELAQAAWVKYRIAEIEAIYPEEDKSFYGTIYPVCAYFEMTRLTQQRIDELNLWLKKYCEGEVCSGSRN